MKVKKRQYKSKRGRPLKKSKTKSKAKKGSKRRVKKMRGGGTYNYKLYDFIWEHDTWATFYGDKYNKIGVIQTPYRLELDSYEKKIENTNIYIVTDKGMVPFKSIPIKLYTELFDNVCGIDNVQTLKDYNRLLNEIKSDIISEELSQQEINIKKQELLSKKQALEGQFELAAKTENLISHLKSQNQIIPITNFPQVQNLLN